MDGVKISNQGQQNENLVYLVKRRKTKNNIKIKVICWKKIQIINKKSKWVILNKMVWKVDLDYDAMNICDSCNNLTMKRSIRIHMSQQYMHELYCGQRKSKRD